MTEKIEAKDEIYHEEAVAGEGRRATITSLTLAKNLDAKVANPLADIPHDDLMRNVEEFAREKDLVDLTDHLKKGALIAQNPSRWQEVEGITEEEQFLLQREHDHKWKHPFALYFTIVVCSIGAAVQGWDQTGS
ncbi:hypothetical protein SLS54_004165 [Diplodia seriata]